ncbi:hypothetical protein [Mesorhizobium comanense]|uniref:hypothetical protein n=1 Tax=Mesorhizobium comanense TaxID=2502215 RepID=UPI0010F8E188|nr:hypothetical protein [Mesorhizobium comanense]
MKSCGYFGNLNIFANSGGMLRAKPRRGVAPPGEHLRANPFSDRRCRHATALEIDKFLLSG